MADGGAGVRQRPLISAVVTAGNEERNIGDCLESLLWCDEILVVDSYSTDRTAEIVRSFPGVRLLQRTYYGAASQKNWAMDQTSHEWVFILDADERCPPELQAEIESVLAASPKHEAYTIRRRVYFMDRIIRFSGWRHDRVVRLFKRGAVRYENKRVHPKAIVRGRAPILRNPMLHFMVESFEQYLPRIVTYGFWGAAEGWRRGRKPGVAAVGGRPAWRFLRMYVLQLGILDGMAGLVFCMLQSFGAYLKYAILWEWRQNAARGRPPSLPEFDADDAVWRFPDEDAAGS